MYVCMYIYISTNKHQISSINMNENACQYLQQQQRRTKRWPDILHQQY